MKRTLSSTLFSLLAYLVVAQPCVIYEETFDGGIPASWEAGPGFPQGAVWQWSATGRADSALLNGISTAALFWNFRPSIASPTAGNGAAMYNSDVYDSGGVSIGAGPFAGTHSGTLASPAIDCSGYDTVYLRFNQYARANANDVSTLVEVSGDGGQSWAGYPINKDIVENGSCPPDDVVLIDISEQASFQPDVRVRFTWHGRYYFWLIDDVQLITPPELELQLSHINYAPASFAQPAWQAAADTFHFAARASNLGFETADSLMLKVSILRVMASNTTLAYSDSTIVSGFPGLAKDSAIALPNYYVPQLPEGEYLLRYELSAIGQADYNPTDNMLQYPFRVSNRKFAKEDDIDFGARPLGTGDYRAANYYRVSPLAADNFIIDKAIFSAAVNPAEGTLAGKHVNILFYKVKDIVSPDFSNFDTLSDNSLELIGYGSYTFSPTDVNFSLISVALESTQGGPVPLEPGARYFLSCAYEGSSNIVLQAFNDDIEYFHISSLIYAQGLWFLGGFGPEVAAVLRMETMMAPTPTHEALPDEALRLFPNPAQDVLQLDVSLEQGGPAMLIIADVQGRVLHIMEYEQLQEASLRFSLAGYSAGAYLLRLSTAQGQRTLPFTVVR